MSTETRDMLYNHLRSTRDTIEQLVEALQVGDSYINVMTHESADELPDDDDEWTDLHEYMQDYPLEVVDERGRNYAVVLTTGGPHIEVEAEGMGRAALHGYWGGEHVVLSGSALDDFLDHYIERG